MRHYCYILYSKLLNRFYIGETSDFEQRLLYHNIGHSRYTSKAKDWELYLLIECKGEYMACKIEKHIKSMKSAKYIRNLLANPEIITKLKSKYDSL